MTYAQRFAAYEKRLVALGEEAEALQFVFRHKKNMSLTDFVLSLNKAVTPEDDQLLEDLFQQLSQHFPAQYILGQVAFSGLSLVVDERALIPRPETEELVSLVLEENQEADLQVLDLCTGSGAIALALKKNRPHWQLSASDISEASIALAKENGKRQNLSVTFISSDLFSALSRPFDLIISNPPYIAPKDKAEVGTNVLAWEPHLALFAEENGLAVFRRIAEEAGAYLTKTGKLYLEIGYKQGQAVKKLFEEHFPNHRVRTLKDSFGKDRMVVVDGG